MVEARCPRCGRLFFLEPAESVGAPCCICKRDVEYEAKYGPEWRSKVQYEVIRGVGHTYYRYIGPRSTVKLFHGGLAAELPEPGVLDFTTDRDLAEHFKDKYGERGILLEVDLPLDGKKPADRRFQYWANMPLQRLGHKQYHYQVGTLRDATEAKRQVLAAAGLKYEIG